MRNSRTLDNEGIANMTRNTLAQSLRRNPYLTFVIQAGYDIDTDTPSLYWFDYFGSMAKPNATAQGLCSYFLLSLFDRHWKKDMTEDEGIALVKMCIDQLQKRYVIKTSQFIIKIVDKAGVRQINLSKNIPKQEPWARKDVDPNAKKTVTGIPEAINKDSKDQPK